jgi:hypothetical protein
MSMPHRRCNMKTRAFLAVGIVVAASLLVVSVAGASEPFKRYTLPAGVDHLITWHGKLTVLLPAGWKVKPGDPSAADPVHKSVAWRVYAQPEEKGTTLADLRARQLGEFRRFTIHGWRDLWGWENGRYRVVGDTYLTLPIGKVWRQTTLVVPGKKLGGSTLIPSKKGGGWAARSYRRTYLVHRGVTTDAATGVEKELFIAFWISCGPAECQTHNAQFATIMRSIRFIP